jgi:adenylate kinase
VEAFEQRLGAYNDQTAALIPYYRAKNVLHEIDGMDSIEQVAAGIGRVIDQAGA